MKIDKTNDGVNFNEQLHVYWDDNGRYDSVTTVIGKFCHEFDSDFWSLYKALEKILEPAAFAMEKKKLLDTKKIDKQYFLDMYEINEDELNCKQQDILDEWAQTNLESCERGTAIHAELEHSLTKNKSCEFKKYGLGGKFNVHSGDIPLEDERGIYPEYLIHVEDGDLRLAGQIDLLIKDGTSIWIVDYKTNKKLEEKSFFDSRTKKNQMMKYPLNNLMDCNKVHYTIQLSLYAWMIQKNNPDLQIEKLILVHYDHKGNVTEHEVDYLKEDVERFMNYWKKRVKVERQKEKRKPIEF